MRIAVYSIFCFLLGCGHHMTRDDISMMLNARIEKPYILNGDKLLREDESFKEYIHEVGEGCRVIYKVDVKTNLAKSWQFLSDAESCRGGLSFYG
jgi:hypothetical protein